MSAIKNLRTGLSCSAFGRIDEEVLAAYAENNIADCEISLVPEAYDTLDWEAVRKAAENTGVNLWSVHLPFSYTVNLAHPEKALREESMLTFRRILHLASAAGVKNAVVHPSSEPIADEDRETLMEYCLDNLAALSREAKLLDMTLAVEDLPRTCLGNCSQEVLRMLSEAPDLRVCFDVNHLLKESHKDFVKNIGSKIVTLHLSDYDFIDEQHQLPGEGKIDWVEIADLLEGIDYNGPFLYECGFLPTGHRAGLKTYTPAIYRQLQMKIANREPLNV